MYRNRLGVLQEQTVRVSETSLNKVLVINNRRSGPGLMEVNLQVSVLRNVCKACHVSVLLSAQILTSLPALFLRVMHILMFTTNQH